MKIALKCQKCRTIWMQGEEELMLEFDFYEQKISCFCPQCKHENILDFKSWQKKQISSPLPKTQVGRY